MKNVIACTACILLWGFYACAQTPKPTSLKEQAGRLKTFFDQHAIEKAYLHFDKPYYAAGDTIYFKAYVVAGEKNALSPLSGVLYADLITPQNTIAKTIKLPIADGLAWGDFALSDSLVTGNYRVRAYTKLMQNYGSDLFFDKVIPIAAIINTPALKPPRAKTKPAKTVAIAATSPDIQFFPEGGELVSGVTCKVALKAISPGGIGIAARGTIFGNNKKEVAKFESAHLGLGVFSLTPAEGETYYAKVLYADGKKDSIALPAVKTNGIAVAVLDSASKISVHINPSKAFYAENKGKALGLFIYSGGKLTTVSDVLDGTDMRFDIQKSGLHSGITQITLLSATGEPLCERLVFIDKDDKLRLNIAADKKVYKQREHVNINLQAEGNGFDDAQAHFSVTVIDKGNVLYDDDKEENILTYLLLTSSLKGNIEGPSYYFNNTDNKKRGELDLVMLTHGYRRFSWKELTNDEIPLATIEPERSLSINGVAKSLGGKPINNGVVTLIPSAGGGLMSDKTDIAGRFNFGNLVFYDSTRFVLNAINARGKNNTELFYHPYLPAPVDDKLYYAASDTSTAGIIQAYLQNSRSRHDQFQKYYGKGIQLKEVKINSVKKPAYYTQSLAGAGNADVLIKGNTLPKAGMLATALAGRIGGVFFVGADNPDGGIPKMQIGNGPMLVIVDGVQRTGSPGQPMGLNDIYPGEVATIEVLKYASAAIYGMSGGNGVIIITTKRGVGVDADDIVARGVLPLTVNGFYKARQFYAPKYDLINDHTLADLRSTIYWQPELMTDKNGNASFDFYNADGTGQYQVIVEGINSNGTAGVARFTYEVKE